MIGKLRGIVDSSDADGLILDVHGVGYLVFASLRTLDRLPPPGGEAVLLIETHVREDHIHLYGFAEPAERDWFRMLGTVQGVGARHGLAILSVLSPQDLATAVAAQDKQAIARANGVGAKLAGRIAAELKDRAGDIAATSPAASFAPGTVAAAAGSGGDGGGTGKASEDAVSALTNLGYRRSEAFAAVAAAHRRLGEAASIEALITEGLKELSQ